MQWYELNVASGQSLIGSIIGFSLVAAGKDSVIWLTPDPKAIPPYKVTMPADPSRSLQSRPLICPTAIHSSVRKSYR